MKALLILFLHHCLAINVVIEQMSECNKPLIESAQIDGDPQRLSFAEYLDYVEKLIEADDAYRGKVDVQDESIKTILNETFHTLADEVCNFYLTGNECDHDFINIFEGMDEGNETPFQTIFLFNVCEKAFEFVIEEVTTLAPSAAPTPNNKQTVISTIQVEVDVGSNNDPAEVAEQHDIQQAFQDLVEDVTMNDVSTSCSLDVISAEFVDAGQKIRK